VLEDLLADRLLLDCDDDLQSTLKLPAMNDR